MKIEDILFNGGKCLGIEIDNEKAEKLVCYAKLLKEWNEKINLTAITDDEGIAVKHFLDSATALCTHKVGEKIIDVEAVHAEELTIADLFMKVKQIEQMLINLT